MNKLLKKTLVFIISVAMIFTVTSVSFADTTEPGFTIKVGDQSYTVTKDYLETNLTAVEVSEENAWVFNDTNKVWGKFYSFKAILSQLGIDASDAHGFKFVAEDGFVTGFSLEDIEKMYVFENGDVKGARGGEAGHFGTAINGSRGNKWATNVAAAEVATTHVWFFKKGKCLHYCSICNEDEPSTVVTTDPTCTEAGLKTTTYSDCNTAVEEELPALGHKLTHVNEAGLLKDGNEYDLCSTCKEKLNVKAAAGYAPYMVKSLKVKKAKKAFTVKWKKQSKKNQKKFNGYQVRYSTKADMSGAKTVKASKKAKSKKVKKLAKKTNYYVQVRTYTVKSGKTFYSNWSPVKTVKTK